MRSKMLSVLVILLLAGPSAFAVDLGSVILDVKSGGSDGPIAVPAGPSSIPIEVYFSATTSGLDGTNGGVREVLMNLSGSALTGLAQSALTPDTGFVNSVSDVPPGLGFNDFGTAGGTGLVGFISQVGDRQSLPFDPSEHAPNVGHSGNVLVATGLLNVNGPGTVSLLSGGGSLWNATRTSADPPQQVISDTLVLVPEPSTLALLSLTGLATLRRRRTPR